MQDGASRARQMAQNDLVLSFLSVRRAIGALGFFLPVALALFGIASGRLLESMSAYFYSPMREVFVGALCAQAVFLWSYEGYREPDRLITDKLVARIASVAAALVALAPTSPPTTLASGSPDAIAATQGCTLLQCLLTNDPTSVLHAVAVVVFFGALAVYCLVLFQRGQDDNGERHAAYMIYRLCGWTIIASIASIGLMMLTGLDDTLAGLRPVFWLELLACFAFATSWAIKGRAMRPVLRAMAAMSRRF